MEEFIDLPITYKGETIHFTAKILAYGYIYKLSVDVNGVEVLFEKDDQGEYRALLADPEVNVKMDVEAVKAILETLAKINDQ
jgi:hypothetical protein